MKLGVIGCGKMSTALVKGAVDQSAISADDLTLYSKTFASADALAKTTGGKAVDSLAQVVEASDILLVGVKPFQMDEVLRDINACTKASKLIISIAAGVTLERLMVGGSQHRYARVMPNTPSLVGAGASAYCLSSTQNEGDADFIQTFLSSVGVTAEVSETQMDAVTGLSGSGPAYIFLLIEALSDGGVRNGLPRDLATKLASQTVMGAAKMQLETGLHPGVLKDQVTSPGGTTITGINALENAAFRSAIINAVSAATEKSKQL